jgi:hypothetical protein
LVVCWVWQILHVPVYDKRLSEENKYVISWCFSLLSFKFMSDLVNLLSVVSCHILVHVKSARLNTPLACYYVQALVVLEGNRSRLPKCPTFSQNKNYFTKTPPILITMAWSSLTGKYIRHDSGMITLSIYHGKWMLYQLQ